MSKAKKEITVWVAVWPEGTTAEYKNEPNTDKEPNYPPKDFDPLSTIPEETYDTTTESGRKVSGDVVTVFFKEKDAYAWLTQTLGSGVFLIRKARLTIY